MTIAQCSFRDEARFVSLAAARLARAQFVLRRRRSRDGGPRAGPADWDRNVFVRVEHIADTLPPADADFLRGQINANRAAIVDAQLHTTPRKITSIRSCGTSRSTPKPCAPPWRRPARRARPSTRSSRAFSRSRRRRSHQPAATRWPTGRPAGKQRAIVNSRLISPPTSLFGSV